MTSRRTRLRIARATVGALVLSGASLTMAGTADAAGTTPPGHGRADAPCAPSLPGIPGAPDLAGVGADCTPSPAPSDTADATSSTPAGSPADSAAPGRATAGQPASPSPGTSVPAPGGSAGASANAPVEQAQAKERLAETGASDATDAILVGAATMLIGGTALRVLPRVARRRG